MSLQPYAGALIAAGATLLTSYYSSCYSSSSSSSSAKSCCGSSKSQQPLVRSFLASILSNLPLEWRGTTFANSNLLGRSHFAVKLCSLLSSKRAASSLCSTVTESELVAVGNAEDYFRVSSNISTLLELVLAEAVNLPVHQVFTFGSANMPLLAVLMTAKLPVVLYVASDCAPPFTDKDLDSLRLLGCGLTVRSGAPKEGEEKEAVVLALQSGPSRSRGAHGVLHYARSTLYIYDTSKISPDDVLVIRKRLATPLTTPACERWLQELAGVPLTADSARATDKSLEAFYSHLQVS
jgi:hypothetical protein